MKNINENPSIVCFGEVLWDVLPDGPQPGGAPMNVAYHLSKLGVKAAVISSVGYDENGRQLLKLLDKWGIDNRLVQINNEHKTSEVVAKTNNKTEVSYEILYPVAWDFIKPEKEMIERVNQSKYFVYGSLASRNDITMNSLLSLLNTPSIKVLDVNLRYPFVKRSILKELMKRADIIKFNEGELDKIQTIFGGHFTNELDKVKFIQNKFGIAEVLVTKGEFGASYFKNEQLINHHGTEVIVEDTIGSGDAFLAGFLAIHMAQLQNKNMLHEAISMGGFIATLKGGCPEYNLEDYYRFKNYQKEKFQIYSN